MRALQSEFAIHKIAERLYEGKVRELEIVCVQVRIDDNAQSYKEVKEAFLEAEIRKESHTIKGGHAILTDSISYFDEKGKFLLGKFT